MTLVHERNMRIHFVCMAYMYAFLSVYDFFEVTRTQFAILFLANALVVAAELINTAVERAVDHASEKRTENGKLAKMRRRRRALLCDFCRRDGRRCSRAESGIFKTVCLLP